MLLGEEKPLGALLLPLRTAAAVLDSQPIFFSFVFATASLLSADVK